MNYSLTADHKKWRFRVFGLTWLAYFGMYFCRKNFSVVMPFLSRELSTTKDEFALVITIYSITYMLGQFLNGYLSDKHGPRLIVGIGLLISVIANLMMGWIGSLSAFFFLMGLNGFGQSSGWSGLVKNLTPWFRKKERGVMMSFWTTCYVIGGMAATAFATYWLTNDNFFEELSWRRVFLAPAFLLLIISILYILFIKNNPHDVGLPAFEKETNTKKEIQKQKDAQFAVLTNGAVWIAAIMYFFVKFTRYSFLFWLPLYLSEALGYSDERAGYTSIAYEAFGFLGILAAGYISDYVYKTRRFPISSLMLFGLGLVLLLQPLLIPLGIVPTIVTIGLIGFFTYGPDSLMSGAAAMDMGKNHGAALAAGVINGVGSAGQLLSPFAVAFVSSKYGWDALFQLFVVVAFLAALLLIFKWNYGKEVKESETDSSILQINSLPNLTT
jgi:sugar phosphate permease